MLFFGLSHLSASATKGKSNRLAIMNALNFCCLAGRVNEAAKATAQRALNSTEGKHFVILLRGAGSCQYQGLYRYLPELDAMLRLTGGGPRLVNNTMIQRFYK
ncbi:unnamed protein product [Protopolystoma xenopodis]|uniref:CKK domain-containing protein n=1 Tax=Protopolystoma xenopodis TaxID=117903 RepID=A0A448WTY8_9PLAT|nr:unnamed protein product [Protopolystoma xenopodis]